MLKRKTPKMLSLVHTEVQYDIYGRIREESRIKSIDSDPSTKLDKLPRILEEFRDEELKNMFPTKVNPRDRLFPMKSIVAGHDPILLHESSGKPDLELSTESHTSFQFDHFHW